MSLVKFKRPDGQNLNIEVLRYAPGDQQRITSRERHRHDFHSISFIQSGYSLQELDFEDYELGPDQILIIPAGTTHLEKEVRNYSAYVILVKDDFFSQAQLRLLNGFIVYAKLMRKLLIPIEASQLANMTSYFDLLFTEQNDTVQQNRTFILQNILLALVNKLEGMIQEFSGDNAFISLRKPFQEFVSLVENNFSQQHQLEFYTSQMQMTARKLNEMLKEIIGTTASNYIIDRTLTEARRLLCFTQKSVKEIAFELGYDSQFYFSRLFKKRTEMSPDQFRKEYGE